MPDAISLSIRELPTRNQSQQAITARLWRRCSLGRTVHGKDRYEPTWKQALRHALHQSASL